MLDRDAVLRVCEKLSKGGSFHRSLSTTILMADDKNLDKLVNAFPELFYEEVAKINEELFQLLDEVPLTNIETD